MIAGPCSAETPEQVLETALALAEDPRVLAFRAGVWKPRTRPGSFEGMGEAALPWLVEVQQQTRLPVIVEVGRATHVEAALKAGITWFWIGARSTANPFTVQEIADALAGLDVPVLIKNPVNPDLDLWIGAVERVRAAGIQKLAVIHRGFASTAKSEFRNPPEWYLPIEFRRRLPEIPMLVDPSHMGGKWELLPSLSQKAMDLGFDGLMVETHPRPTEAWSDARQQITPAAFRQLLDQLVIRQTHSDDQEYLNRIESLRARLDEMDRDILTSLAYRMELVREIGELKRANNVTVLQLERWNRVVSMLQTLGERLGLDRQDVLKLYELIHDASIRTQEEIVNRG